jgi:hypothetical protein
VKEFSIRRATRQGWNLITAALSFSRRPGFAIFSTGYVAVYPESNGRFRPGLTAEEGTKAANRTVGRMHDFGIFSTMEYRNAICWKRTTTTTATEQSGVSVSESNLKNTPLENYILKWLLFALCFATRVFLCAKGEFANSIVL